MSAEKIIGDWKKNIFKPIYWLEGEESYYIDKILQYAEHHILTPSESEFNLSIFYGKDAQWATVVNACNRFPMFAEKQVVILKEAQHMKDLPNLESYMERPQPSTILIIGYKEKKLDSRTKFSKVVKKNGEVYTTKKLMESALPGWITQLVKSLGYSMSQKAVLLLADHIGNDLSRIENEIEKVTVNLKDRNEITEQDIETYVGISKEFNIFELQNALAYKDLAKAIRIVQYFGQNPKAVPIQLILPTLYGFFSKASIFFDTGNEKEAERLIGYYSQTNIAAAKTYGSRGIENIIMLLHQYNLRSIGVGKYNADGELLKELMVKIMA